MPRPNGRVVLYVRDMEPDAAIRIKRAARVRNIQLHEYLERLIDLHDSLRQLSSADGIVRKRIDLKDLKLEPMKE